MGRNAKVVGIVGLGIMGGAFARNLVAAGWRVVGFDVSAARCRDARKAGVRIAADTQTLAREAPTIILSLPNPQALHATVDHIIAAKAKARVVVEMGTFSLDDKLQAERALRKAGHIALDCPVSGTGAQAQKKDLLVYASGSSAAIRRLRPMFAGFSRLTHDLGAFGNGSRMKYVANLLVAIHNVATAEAFVLGMKAGLSPKAILELIPGGAGNSRVFELRGPMMAKDRYDRPTMRMATWQKDMDVIGEFAQHLGCPTPLFSATLPLYASALANGHGAEDTAAVCAVLESMAGLKRRRPAKARNA